MNTLKATLLRKQKDNPATKSRQGNDTSVSSQQGKFLVQFGVNVLKLALALLACAPFGFAQAYLGSIQGDINDSTGAKIPGATITAEEETTHFKTTVKSNGVGAYALVGLTPGTYDLTITASGFKQEKRDGVVLISGEHKAVDLALVLGAASESVEVVGAAPLIDTGSPNTNTTMSTQEVTDIPNEGRNPFVMATLAVGIYNNGSGGYFLGKSSQYTNPFSGVAVQIGANGNGGHNRITLDGIPDDPPERLSGASYTGFVPSPEAVQEVSVQSGIVDAQIGHGNGTVTNTVVRNGGNAYHGAVYSVFQNTYLNANTSDKVPTQNAAVNPTHRNNDQLNQSGFVFDGAVRIPKLYNGRDKTFFLVAFERYDSHTALNYSARVPTPAEIGGDFSGLCSTFNSSGLCTSGIQLYQPNSPVDANGNRTQFFANNNIASAINASGAALATYLPQPNVTGASLLGTNYISTQTSYHSTYPSFIVRADHELSANNKFNAIYFQAGLTQNFPLQGFPKGIGPGGYGYHVTRATRGGSLDDVQTLSTSMVLESRLGVTYHPFDLQYPGNQNFDLTKLGISGTGLPYTSFPGASVGDGYASLAAGAGGQISEATNGSLQEVLNKVFGNHDLRIGFEGNLIRYNVQNPQNGFGTFGYDRRFTQKNSINVGVGADASSGDSFADLLLGYASSLSYSINPSYALQQVYMAPFVQDDWHLNPRLTVNLGLRYDYESPFTERYNKQVTNFCTTCVNPLQASVSGLTLNGGLQYASSSNRFPYPRDLNNIQPRVGAAYLLRATTVVRAGFGIIYFNTLESPIGTGYQQTTSYSNYLSSAPLNSISNPFPNGIVQPAGNSLGLSTALGQSVSFVDPHHVQPKSAQYSFNIQQQFPDHFVLQVGYQGSKPTRLEVNHNINILPAQYYNQGAAEVGILNAVVANPMAGKIPLSTTLNAAKIQQNLLYLPYPEFGSVTEDYSSIGSSPYNALQIQLKKTMSHHYEFQANFTWDKIMVHTGYLDNFAAAMGKLESVEDSGANKFGNVFGTVQLPKFEKHNYYERLALGGWELNTVVRFSNGPRIGAPGNIDIIGNPQQPGFNLRREYNTCYLSASIVNNAAVYTQVNTTINSSGVPTVTACDSTSPTPAFRQRIQYTSQNNSTVLNIRIPISPLMDASLFKKFAITERTSFEIRGEFFNIMNTSEFNGPGGLGASNAGSALSASGLATQANDPRIGQLTARFNF